MNSQIDGERNVDFIRRAIRHTMDELSAGRDPGTRRIAVMTVFGGADSFHIGFERAQRLVGRYFALPPLVREQMARTGTPAQLRCIHMGQRVKELMEKDPKMTITDALTRVYFRGGAPRFYMGVDYAMTLVRKYNTREKALMCLAARKRREGEYEN